MTDKHTPGPWVTDGRIITAAPTAEFPGDLIARVSEYGEHSFIPNGQANNARRIVALDTGTYLKLAETFHNTCEDLGRMREQRDANVKGGA